MTEDETVGWHHRLDGREFEQPLGDSEEQGSLECCSPWGCKELGTTEQLTEKAVASHSSTLAWKIPWMEEPGRLPSMGSHRVGHD